MTAFFHSAQNTSLVGTGLIRDAKTVVHVCRLIVPFPVLVERIISRYFCHFCVQVSLEGWLNGPHDRNARTLAPNRSIFIVEWPRSEPMDLDIDSDSTMKSEEEMGREKPSGTGTSNHNHYSE